MTTPKSPQVTHTQSQLKQVATVEKLADSIVIGKHELVDLDRRHNQNREAIRAIKKESSGYGKAWLLYGSSGQFFSFPKEEAIDTLQSSQQKIERRKEEVHTTLKDEVAQLQRLQGKELNEGFDLKGSTWTNIK
eukprot:m.210699 g.210699  ORF g.210699 m.210699 type:complete len:134 (-) comp13782_c0_seq3:5361-5762(-)